MVDRQLYRCGNLHAAARKAVVHLGDTAVNAVFKRQHAIAAKTGFHAAEHAFKILEIQNFRLLEQLTAGKRRIRALHALTGDRRGFRKSGFMRHRVF